MLRGIYSAASGMIHTQAKQDATANNLANSEVAGYKQDKIVTKPFDEVMLQNRSSSLYGAPAVREIGKMSFGVESGEVYTDFAQGTIIGTGNNLDFAIEGKGFFAIQSFDGIKETVQYTREGSFSLDREGRLVTSQGGYVLGRNINTGEVGPLTLSGSDITVDSSGAISMDSERKYRFNIVDFEDYSSVTKVGNNLYTVLDQRARPMQLQPGEYDIRQQHLERSNTDVSGELVSMISNLRNYQANQRVISSIDETLGKAVNEVGSIR